MEEEEKIELGCLDESNNRRGEKCWVFYLNFQGLRLSLGLLFLLRLRKMPGYGASCLESSKWWSPCRITPVDNEEPNDASISSFDMKRELIYFLALSFSQSIGSRDFQIKPVDKHSIWSWLSFGRESIEALRLYKSINIWLRMMEFDSLEFLSITNNCCASPPLASVQSIDWDTYNRSAVGELTFHSSGLGRRPGRWCVPVFLCRYLKYISENMFLSCWLDGGQGNRCSVYRSVTVAESETGSPGHPLPIRFGVKDVVEK